MDALAVRVAKKADGLRIRAFLEANPSPHVLSRDEEISRAIDRDEYFLVEFEGAIVAVSGVFDLSDDVQEMGGARVAERFQGFGLQKILQKLRVAAVTLNNNGKGKLMTAVDPTNVASVGSTVKSGFSIWADPIDEVFGPCAGCSKRAKAQAANRKCCCDYYVIAAAERKNSIRELLGSGTSVVLGHRGGDRSVSIDLNVNFLRDEKRKADLAEYCDEE